MKFSRLFSPGKIGKLRLKNRVVMPPMVRNYADARGLVTKRYIDHIDSIARGGVGMMILEASFIEPAGRGFANQLAIDSDKTIPGLKKLAAAAHKHKAKIGIQIYHAGRQTTKAITGFYPVAPSAIPDPLERAMPRALDAAGIRAIIGKFAAAALRAKRAGLDFVEIHGAHGYLVNQFLSPFSNKRTDAYGGSQEKRNLFMREIYRAVRVAVGSSYPILIRLSADEMVKGGLGVDEMKEVGRAIADEGIDAIDVSVGVYGSYEQGFMIAPMVQPDALLLKYARAMKQAVDVPVIAVGKIREPWLAERALRDGSADFVAVGRSLLADPEWPNKAMRDRVDLINPCVACNQGCIQRLFSGQDVQCTVNPATSREAQFAAKPRKSKKVLIVGGGPAGLVAAKYAAMRGHQVTLYEKDKRLGGQVLAAAGLPHRNDWKLFLDHLVADLKRLRVKIVLGREFAPSLIKKGQFDSAIVAVGSVAAKPGIPGINRGNVILARDFNQGKAKAAGRVVVAGGGCQGAQTAEALALKHYSVTLVEMTNRIAADSPLEDQAMLLSRLAGLGVKVMTNTKIKSFGSESVSVEKGKKEILLPADTVVVCLGAFPNDSMGGELALRVPKVQIVGDAVKPRRITEAAAEGACAALVV
jgi:2,4-dienoyl-CoA reductase-like NADH-dependent reductase (Old Yellow Enzyme family)/thioredoxin reductase